MRSFLTDDGRISLLLLALLASCGQRETVLEQEARHWLAGTYEVDSRSLELRDVRRVGEHVCGEARYRLVGADVGYRLFAYRPGVDGAFDSPLPRVRLPGSSGCDPIPDEIRSICAPEPAQREAAKLRVAKCAMGSRL